MSDGISNNRISSESVSRKNDSENDFLDVQIQQREYYEEFIERKRHVRHERLTKKFYIAQKKQKQYQQQISINERHQILKVKKKIITGPQWFQELSDKQLNILHSFGETMKEDYDLKTSKNTRRTLKTLGVTTFIPHTVAMEALYASELHPVLYLTEIKNYLTQKGETSSEQAHLHKHDEKNKDYPLEIRILMSSIMNLAFPNLIEKLNYCLSKPEPDQTLEYTEIPKSKGKSVTYFSPYLEPLPEPTMPWNEAEKIKLHNIKVKKQKIRKKMEHDKEQRLREMKLKKMKQIESKMKIKYPEHPLEKMFYNPPIVKDFGHPKTIQQNNQLNTTTSRISGDTNNVDDASTFSTQLSPLEPTEEIIEKRNNVVVNKSLSSESSLPVELPVIDEKVNDKNPSVSTTQMSMVSMSRHRVPVHDVSDPKNDSGWLKTDSLASKISLDSSYKSSVIGTSEENVNTVMLDFDSSMSSFNGQIDCSTIIAKNDENVTFPKEKLAKSQNNKNDVDGGLSLAVLRNVNFLKMDNSEINVWKEFKNPGDCIGSECTGLKLSTYFPAVSVDTAIDIHSSQTKESIDIKKTSIEPEMPLLRQNQNERLEQSNGGKLPKSEVGGNIKTISLDKKLSLAEFFPAKNEGNIPPSSSTKYVRDELSAVSPSPRDYEDGSINLDGILAVLRQLPALKQLQAVLNLLSVMGDPIAGYPELIELKKLRRWYERRLNRNRPITSKMKKDLLNKSINAWNTPRTQLSGVTIPRNPIRPNNNDEKTTWDQVNVMKQTIKKMKTNYTVKMKHVAINNARQMYSSMENNNDKNRLCRNFKQTYFNYFPVKENDCLFENPLTSYKSQKKSKDNED